jgi:hypothetical protein
MGSDFDCRFAAGSLADRPATAHYRHVANFHKYDGWSGGQDLFSVYDLCSIENPKAASGKSPKPFVFSVQHLRAEKPENVALNNDDLQPGDTKNSFDTNKLFYLSSADSTDAQVNVPVNATVQPKVRFVIRTKGMYSNDYKENGKALNLIYLKQPEYPVVLLIRDVTAPAYIDSLYSWGTFGRLTKTPCTN